jgi:hypothetical protein
MHDNKLLENVIKKTSGIFEKVDYYKSFFLEDKLDINTKHTIENKSTKKLSILDDSEEEEEDTIDRNDLSELKFFPYFILKLSF